MSRQPRLFICRCQVERADAIEQTRLTRAEMNQRIADLRAQTEERARRALTIVGLLIAALSIGTNVVLTLIATPPVARRGGPRPHASPQVLSVGGESLNEEAQGPTFRPGDNQAKGRPDART
ncbi:hypothetical protein [Thermomonospora umbrina]|uniref:Uncharacterized protein n=1 Tax=Thermomonospora umbrina TaxID=111806 RepID=A0A3D9T2K1_9ACTN|nr:hypothetical protein [Thermomonospora umbrina]REF00584.1 hypothetical protein DFJ69_6135 [Thermomonospora umbrina]